MKTQSVAAIQSWLVSQLSEVLYVEPDEIDVREPFAYYGLSSSQAAIVSGDLEVWLERALSPTLLYEYPTVEALANYLSGEEAAAPPAEVRRAEIVRAHREAEVEPIAIVGIGCRVPGADGVEAFWQLLRDGVDAITEVPADRWDLREFYDPEPTAPGKMNTRWGGFLDSVDQFDPHVFGISPREAERMDPQQRLLMEVAWEALEDAGIAAEKVRGARAGVFVGITNNDYCRLQMSDAKLVDAYAGTGNASSIAANRLSYFFDLRGPSITIDSACSSGLVAVHLACQSLRNGESTVALVGAANVILSPEYTIIFAKAGLLAPDGRCKVFDSRANGYVRGEGAGVVVLKPLSRAIADGDPIYATILGSAVNQDGRTNGLTSPSRSAQEAMLLEAYARAGVSPGEVQYVEAHGTGTELGDPIEAKALGAVLALDRAAESPCAVGSVKSNIGHLEAAAGIVGLIKVALSLKHKEIPPSLHFKEPNPHIPFGEIPLRVQQRLEPWPQVSGTALAGVSAFGFGGTNAHVVLAEASVTPAQKESRPFQLLTLSAKTDSALDAATANLARHLKQHPNLDLADVAYTLQTGRALFNHRRVAVCRDIDDAVTKLEALTPGSVFTHTEEATSWPVTFMFAGVGDHYRDMAAGLYRTEAAFREELDRCCELLRPLLGLDLRQHIFSEETLRGDGASTNGNGVGKGVVNLRQMLSRDDSRQPTDSPLYRTRYAQPAVFAVEYALARLLQSWGVRPQQLIGYSLGEYVAACLSGVFSIEDALTVVARRAELIEGAEPGAMLAVNLGEEELRGLLTEGLEIAIINGSRMCIVGGESETVGRLERELIGRDVACRRLAAEHAFHTRMMQPVAEEFAAVLRQVKLSEPQIPIVSNVTGQLLKAEEATDPQYWVRHLCEAVRFSDGLGEVLKEPSGVIVEVGCGQSLGSFVKQHESYGESAERAVVGTLRHEWEGVSDEEVLAGAVGRLWLGGVGVEWGGYHGGDRRRVRLPTYPFERQRFWMDTETASVPQPEDADSSEAKADVEDWFFAPRWTRAALPSASEFVAGNVEEGCWLVLAGGSAITPHLEEHLRRSSLEVITVEAGAGFSCIGDNHYAVRPGEKADYDALFKELRGRGVALKTIVHLWDGIKADPDSRRHDSLDEALDTSFFSLVFIAQSLGVHYPSDKIQLAVITSGAQKVTGAETETLSPLKAAATGPCRVIPQEYQNLTCRSIDLSSADADEETAARIVAELTTQSADVLVAWRGAERWVQTVEPVRLPSQDGAAVRLREEGVYFITGGLGGIGFGLAEFLGRTRKARLSLVGRKGLPPAEGWAQWLASHDDEDETSRLILRIRALEEAGAKVLVQRADVTSLEEMTEAVRLTEEHFGAIHGVIHAAGVPGAGLIQLKTREAAARVLAPKVKGTLVLNEVFGERPLDFLALFSSIASIVGGGPGQVDYCAANAFLDAFAQANARRHGLTVSIDWAEWQWNAWGEGLAGFDAELRSRLTKNRNKYGLTIDEGAEALVRILGSDFSQLIVSTRPFEGWVAESRALTAAALGETKPRVRRKSAHARPALGTAYVAATGAIESKIAAVWQKALGIERVGIHDRFFDLGGTSLIGLQVIAELNKELNAELPTVALYQAPTVNALAEYVRAEAGGGVARADAEKPGRRARVAAEGEAHDGIAIIGMAGRFPGAKNVGVLWDNLLRGAETITFFSDEELKAAGVSASAINDPKYVKAASVLEDIESFDASLFGYSPREAEVMDPQHRLFLECAWEALEDGGYDSHRYEGAVGVFGGSNISTYLLSLYADSEVYKSLNPMQTALGNANDSLTTKVSYKLNLRGPSVAVQTFCSTSAVAVHLACQSLLQNSCDMALAGGVRVTVPHRTGYFYEAGGIDSPDGHCRAFDARGQGAVLGNGAGIVLLKRLSEALADGDHIYAVIKGSAINNDGSLKVGYTAPSVEGQSAVVAEAIGNAGVEPDSISYIEAHGTGTELGDPIEVAALTKAFRTRTDEKRFCAIGSVKTNFGHLDRAAGVTSLIKTALSLKNEALPPSLHFNEPNPKIDFENSPFYVNTELREWKRNDQPRRAGVNALGIGGTNVHFILEEAPPAKTSGPSRAWQALLLSAHTETALETATDNLAAHLRQNPGLNLADIAYTLQVGRIRLDHCRMLVCRDTRDAAEALESREPRRVLSRRVEARSRPVTFMFGGVGDHYRDMAAGLYQTEPLFREELDRCCELLRPVLGLDLRQHIFSDETLQGGDGKGAGDGNGNGGGTLDLRQLLARDDSRDPAGSPLHRTRYAQPAVFAVEYALARLLVSWGVHPQQLIGYSLGEYVAACLSGVFSIEDALLVVARRAELIERVEPGAMLAVNLSEQELRPLLSEGLDLSIINGRQMCVVGGGREAVEGLERELTGRGVACRRLAAEHAFHTPMMKEVADDFAGVLRGVTLNGPQIPVVSNVTGVQLTAEEATDPQYWVRHLCETVRFSDGLTEVLREPAGVIIEVGCGQSLGSFVKQHESYGESSERSVVSTLRHEWERVSDEEVLAGAVGRLWLGGVGVEWGEYHGDNRWRVQLPTYPFERQRFWIETRQDGGGNHNHRPGSGKRGDVAEWFYKRVWAESPLSASGQPGASEKTCWLIFKDDCGAGARLAERLKAEGHQVVTATAGAEFGRAGDDAYIIRRERAEDYEELIRELREKDRVPAKIAHLWSLTPARGDEPESPAWFAEAQSAGFYSLIYLAKALSAQRVTTPLQLDVVSNALQDITGLEELAPGKATLLAICKVIPQEFPNIKCRSVDVPQGASGREGERLVEQLHAELNAAPRDLVVCYRGQRRYVEAFEPLRLGPLSESPKRLREGGVYLITGGLGGVGYALAQYLFRTVRARLVLVGRTHLPERAGWEQWLAEHEERDGVSRKIRKVLALEQEGAEVLAAGADVADERQMREVLARSAERFGGLNGVIHGAGVVSLDSLQAVQQVDKGLCERHFRPKIEGLLVLEKLLRDERPDFVFLLSSLSSVLGGIGFVSYAASNIFMDSFAQARNRAGGTRWLTVNWDTWDVRDEEARQEVKEKGLETTVAEFAMTAAEGVEAFARVLGCEGETHFIHSTGDLESRLDQWIRRTSLEQKPGGRKAAGTLYSRPNLTTAYVPVNDEAERKIAEVYQRVLGIEKIGLHDNYFDLGGTSLSAIQVVSELQKEFDAQISPITLFEAPTVHELAKHLAPAKGREQPQDSLKSRVERRRNSNRGRGEGGIAIIGMTGRFPGAPNVDALWRNLCDGVESVSSFTDEELKEAGVDPKVFNGPNYVRVRPIIENPDLFDAGFFGYSPREAEFMDPQHRLFIETAWEALENAGYDTFRYDGSVGVFAGTNISTYGINLLNDPDIAASFVSLEGVIAHDKDSLTTSVSYKLNLRGPSIAVQTFCSTSLVAVHLACQSILNGECDMALAGGVSIRVPQKFGYQYDPGGQDSPDGHTRAFDAKAKGTVFGDGVATVVLKRLEDALADGDTIHAVIKGSAINNDGSLKVGYTAPSVEGQAEVVAVALANAGVDPRTVRYVEAHGSATELGDPIEVAALSKAFRLSTDATGFCALGSVKTNVGHLDRAAGVTGLIKAALSLRHRLLPPSLHYESPNPNIDFEHSPFFVNTELREWEREGGLPRRAGVNSLGVGGTNVHVVLEEAPAHASPAAGGAEREGRGWQVVLLSARSEAALGRMGENLAAHLREHPEESLADVAYTLQVGRRRFNHRRMLVCRDTREAVEALESKEPRRVLSRQLEAKSRPVTFMFGGVGDHYRDMAAGLYHTEAAFREELDRCCELLRPVLGVDLRKHIFSDETLRGGKPAASANGSKGDGSTLDLRQLLSASQAVRDPADSPLHRTRYAQPAVFAVEYALARLLQSWGVSPQQLIGYSLGEYVAACLSGVFSIEDALLVVARRAELIERVEPGAMLAVNLSEQELRPLLSEGLDLSIINGRQMCVVGGGREAVEGLERELTERGVACRRLAAEHAFHTSMMREVADDFAAVLQQVRLNEPGIPVISNVTGVRLTTEEATDPQYWVRHLCETVRFSDGLTEVLREPTGVIIEVGCGQSLGSFVKQHESYGESSERSVVSTLRHEWEPVSDEEVLAGAVGRLWLSGVEVEWGEYHGDNRRRVQLPTYPFERQRFWIEPKKRNLSAVKRPQSQDDLERIPNLADWFYVPVWKQSVPLIVKDEEGPLGGVWMLMTDGSSLAVKLAEQLTARGEEVISVGVSEEFERINDSSYAVNPRRRGDYDLLLKELDEKNKAPARVLHLWNLASIEDASSTTELTREVLDLGFYSVMFLAQALGDIGVDSTDIITISSESQKVTGNERLCPAKATLLGPAIVIPCEYTNIFCRGLDVDLPRPDSEEEDELLQLLLAEFRQQCKDTIIAYRGRQRWVQGFEPLPLDAPSAPAPRLREGGTYLVTGGLGGIGLAVAEHLARRARANLVLVGRTGLPARERWASLLADADTPAALARKLAQVEALEALGSEVLALAADVGDAARMREVVRESEARFGKLDGVVHAAGVPGAGLIQLKTREAAAGVLRPKVEGTLALEEALEGRQLDFLVLFSSMTSIVGGGPGQLDYCAANAFLDAYAQQRGSRRRPVFAVNWGEWQWDAWQEGLLGFDSKLAAYFKENRRRFGVSFEEGLDALTRIMATDLPQVVVSTRDFKELLVLSKEFTVNGILSEADKGGAPGQSYPRPALSTSYIAPGTEVEKTIAGIWQELLRIEQVGLQDNFFELGGNSLLGINLVGLMKRRLKVEMPMYALYEAPTVSAMAKLVAGDEPDEQSLDERRDRGEKRRQKQQERKTGVRGEFSVT